MQPKQGDVVYLCTADNKKTHNYTYIGVVWERQNGYYHIHDKFAVPMKIYWGGECWIQRV